MTFYERCLVTRLHLHAWIACSRVKRFILRCNCGHGDTAVFHRPDVPDEVIGINIVAIGFQFSTLQAAVCFHPGRRTPWGANQADTR